MKFFVLLIIGVSEFAVGFKFFEKNKKYFFDIKKPPMSDLPSDYRRL